jgi:hypothetical protein
MATSSLPARRWRRCRRGMRKTTQCAYSCFWYIYARQRETDAAARREIATRPAGRAPRRGHTSRDDSRGDDRHGPGA